MVILAEFIVLNIIQMNQISYLAVDGTIPFKYGMIEYPFHKSNINFLLNKQKFRNIICFFLFIRYIYGPHICGNSLDIDPNYNHLLSGSWRKTSTLQVYFFIFDFELPLQFSKFK
jgi:hypothetical protein